MIITPDEIESFFTERKVYTCSLCKLDFTNNEHKLEHLKQEHKFIDIANKLELKVVEFKT